MSGNDAHDGGQLHSRRRLLVGGSAVAAGAWVTPAVLSLDRVAAAAGTCGAAPVRVDWTDHADNGPAPSSVTANDGTVVTLSTSDPFSVAGSRHFTVRTDLYGGVTGFLASEMVGGNNGEYVDITLDFSRAVQPCFTLLDVDRDRDRWEDTVEILGTLSGVPVTLTSSDILTGGANAFVANNTIRGTKNKNTPGSKADANATVSYPSPVDSILIRYSDQTSWTTGQIMGIFDLLWC